MPVSTQNPGFQLSKLATLSSCINLNVVFYTFYSWGVSQNVPLCDCLLEGNSYLSVTFNLKISYLIEIMILHTPKQFYLILILSDEFKSKWFLRDGLFCAHPLMELFDERFSKKNVLCKEKRRLLSVLFMVKIYLSVKHWTRLT